MVDKWHSKLRQPAARTAKIWHRISQRIAQHTARQDRGDNRTSPMVGHPVKLPLNPKNPLIDAQLHDLLECPRFGTETNEMLNGWRTSTPREHRLEQIASHMHETSIEEEKRVGGLDLPDEVPPRVGTNYRVQSTYSPCGA